MAKIKVLLVEDNMHLRLLTRKMLEKAECEVIEANDGMEALKAIQLHDEIKIAFVDIMMPHLDGLSFVKKIAPLKKDMQIKICMLTAKGGIHDVKECLREGADDYLVKPADPMLIAEKVRTLSGANYQAPFSMVKVNSDAFIAMPPENIPINIQGISEAEITFNSCTQLPVGARVHVQGGIIGECLGEKNLVLCRLYSVERSGKDWVCRGSFIGLTEMQMQKLRSTTVKGEIAS